MNTLKSDLIKKDRNDIDNFLLYHIKSENNYLSKRIYNKFIKIPVVSNSRLRWKIRTIFQNKINALGQEYGISFPYNLETPALKIYYNKDFMDNISFYRKEYIRVYNWIKSAILYFPLLKTFIKFTQSCNGQYSPHTHINLWMLSLIGSPGKVDYLLKRLFFQAKLFINIFDTNFLPSYRVISNFIAQKIDNIDSFDNINIKFTRNDALQIAVHTLINYHPFITKIDDSNLTNINRIFLGGLCNILTPEEVFIVRSTYYCNMFLSYSTSVKVLTLLRKIKNNDITELALMCI